MEKYVCDFDVVNEKAKKLCSIATDISTSADNYSTKIDSDLSGWTGGAKTKFEATNSDQVAITKTHSYNAEDLGEFILKVSESIEKIEQDLASLKI